MKTVPKVEKPNHFYRTARILIYYCIGGQYVELRPTKKITTQANFYTEDLEHKMKGEANLVQVYAIWHATAARKCYATQLREYCETNQE